MVVQLAAEDGEVVDAAVGQQVVVADDRDAQPAAAGGQSMSKALAYGDSWPRVRTCHHHSFSSGRATPTWLGTMSTSTPIPSRFASVASAASPDARPREGSIARWSETS